ncbi:MAG: hypothetical protein Q7W55_11320 [Pseudohongiella sp.]|nr:hypothetical protein [Pseudohongiella sp.]MDO9519602.1 hypothetical protein [Pseudohongiella sp.]MDP2127703.1 hypothetical protein [Pseudohongiella sp.]
MAEWRMTLIQTLNSSPLRELSDSFLRSIPGLPPILQTIHLLGVAVLLGSIVMLSLRILGVAAKSQSPAEMSARVFPWFFYALPVMLFSALPFFLARPQRYLVNPVFGIKAIAFVAGLCLSIWMWQQCRQIADKGVTLTLKLTAAVVIFVWVLTTLAGRWIAYADYIFWPG